MAEAGVDWDLLRAWRQRRQTMLSHGLDGDDADALTLVVGAALSVMAEGAEALGADEDERDGAAILMAGLLERPAVAAAVWNELERRGRTRELEPFLSELDDRLDGVEIVGPGWLRARVLEADGRSAEAAQLLGTVVGSGCRHTPALLDLAGYAADRSELTVAADLIRRSGADGDRATRPIRDLDDHHDRLLDEIAGYRRVEASAQIGRNQPCPCGSGRKFKACHLRSGYVTIEDRAGWLNDKMVRYALQHGATIRAEVAAALAGGDPLVAIDLEVSPLTIELALWEGKLIDGFAASRRALLPDDEAALLDGWTSAHRSIMRVAGIDGKRLTFDDLIRGGQRVVDNIELQAPLQPGTIMLARPVPVGEVNRMLSPTMPLDADAADALAPAVTSGDPIELATALERVLGPQRGRIGR